MIKFLWIILRKNIIIIIGFFAAVLQFEVPQLQALLL